MPAILRFDGNNNQASAPALLGSAVTDLCGMFGLRVSNCLGTAQGLHQVYNVPVAAWGASSSTGAGAFGPGTGVSWITLGYRWPQYNPLIRCGWEVLLKPNGTSVSQAATSAPPAPVPTGLPARVGFRFHGGATAAARYLELWVGGQMVASVSGAAVPATLDLSSAFTLCPQDGTDMYRAGIDLDFGVIGQAAWSAGQMAQLDAWIKKRGATAAGPTALYPDIAFQEIFGSGLYGSDPESFSLGPFISPSGAANGLIAVTTLGNSDPADNFHCPRRLSTDNGGTWGTQLTMFDPNGAASPGGYDISPALALSGANAGKVLALFSDSPATPNYPWNAYKSLSPDGGATFPTPLNINAVTGLPPNYVYNPGTFLGYWSPAGTVVELSPGGVVRALCEGWYSTDPTNNTLGKYRIFIIECDPAVHPNFDQWTFLVDVSAAAGTTGTGTNLAEASMVHVAGTGSSSEWVLVARQNGGGSTKITRSLDDCATWGPFLTMGDQTNMNGGGITETSMWWGSSDPSSRLWVLQPPRNAYETAPPNPTFTANRSPGLCLAWSSTKGERWDNILQLTFGPKGWHYGSGMDRGDGFIVIGTTTEWQRGAVLTIPYSAFSWPGN
jgi:hypothetical protein